MTITVNPKPDQRRKPLKADFALTVIKGGFPHSEIVGSKLIRSSPTLIAAYHVLHRLCMPRHPPDALKTLDHSHCRYSFFRKEQTQTTVFSLISGWYAGFMIRPSRAA